MRQLQNFHDLGFKWTARKYIMLSIRKVLLELDIRYYPPVQPVRWDSVGPASATMPARGPTVPPSAGGMPRGLATATAPSPGPPTVFPGDVPTFAEGGEFFAGEGDFAGGDGMGHDFNS